VQEKTGFRAGFSDDMASAGQAGTGELVGRDAELTRLRTLVDPAPDDSRVLVVLGDAGMGKSALLADMARRASSAGMQVLSVIRLTIEDGEVVRPSFP
jgi:DNA replication protein DnaC